MKPDLVAPFEYGGKIIGCEWFDASTLEQLPGVTWQQVYVIGKLGGKVPVVIYKDDHANLPGGKTEPGETVEQTLKREIKEELNCEVLDWSPVGYQKLTEPGRDESIYQLRVYAELRRLGNFEKDTGGEVVGYKLVGLETLNETINYGRVGERMVSIVKSRFLV